MSQVSVGLGWSLGSGTTCIELSLQDWNVLQSNKVLTESNDTQYIYT